MSNVYNWQLGREMEYPYDAAFPDHPLSQVRRQMALLMAGLAVNEPASRCAPYRVGPAAAVASAPVPAPAAGPKKARPWWRPW